MNKIRSTFHSVGYFSVGILQLTEAAMDPPNVRSKVVAWHCRNVHFVPMLKHVLLRPYLAVLLVTFRRFNFDKVRPGFFPGSNGWQAHGVMIG